LKKRDRFNTMDCGVKPGNDKWMGHCFVASAPRNDGTPIQSGMNPLVAGAASLRGHLTDCAPQEGRVDRIAEISDFDGHRRSCCDNLARPPAALLFWIVRFWSDDCPGQEECRGEFCPAQNRV
jgi:hypothetical protein